MPQASDARHYSKARLTSPSEVKPANKRSHPNYYGRVINFHHNMMSSIQREGTLAVAQEKSDQDERAPKPP
jgi:hypothetical protein